MVGCTIFGGLIGLGLSRWIGLFTVINSATRGNTFGQGVSKFGHRVLKAMLWGLLLGFIIGIVVVILMAIFCHGKEKKQSVQQYRDYVATHPGS